MKISLSTFLLVIGFFCIALGGVTTAFRMIAKRTGAEPADFALLMAVWSPMWFPLAFLSYAVGRRNLNVSIVVVFGIAEAIGVGAMAWATNH